MTGWLLSYASLCFLVTSGCKEQQQFQFSLVNVALVKKSEKVRKYKKPFHSSGNPSSQLTGRSHLEYYKILVH